MSVRIVMQKFITMTSKLKLPVESRMQGDLQVRFGGRSEKTYRRKAARRPVPSLRTGRGGNLINLVERLNPSWTMHEVLGYLEKQIKEKRLQFNEDYNARILEEEKKRQWFEGKRSEYRKATTMKRLLTR